MMKYVPLVEVVRGGLVESVHHGALVMIDSDGTETIYPSVADAARSLGISRASIHTVCTGRNKTGGGYKWKYFKEQL